MNWLTTLLSSMGAKLNNDVEQELPPLENKESEIWEIGRDWEGLLRGTLMGATIQKFMDYVNLADQKAQAIIILNSVIIPLALTGLDDPEFKIGATISILAAIGSIFGAIICIYPKRKEGHKPDGTKNYFHFGDIGQMSEKRFLQEFLPVYNDSRLLSVEVAKSLHDMSKYVILPKFRWLKVSYGSFFIGNLIAISWTLIQIWFY